MVGFVTELPEEENEDLPLESWKDLLRLKGRSRAGWWGVLSLRASADSTVRRRYLRMLWAAALRGRPARQQQRAEVLAHKCSEALLRKHYALLMECYTKLLQVAEDHKEKGNALYSSGETEQAIAMYTKALEVAPRKAAERAAYYSNRAACNVRLERWREVEKDCTKALELKPNYEKALLRRMAACENLQGDDYYTALADAEAIVKLQPDNKSAKAAVVRLTPVVEKRKKEQMDEAMESLKGVGNSILGYFGMSIDQFKATQNPDGTYGISYEPNKA